MRGCPNFSKYVNAGGSLSSNPSLNSNLASCLKVGLDLSTEPPQVPGFKCKDS